MQNILLRCSGWFSTLPNHHTTRHYSFQLNRLRVWADRGRETQRKVNPLRLEASSIISKWHFINQRSATTLPSRSTTAHRRVRDTFHRFANIIYPVRHVIQQPTLTPALPASQNDYIQVIHHTVAAASVIGTGSGVVVWLGCANPPYDEDYGGAWMNEWRGCLRL